MKPNLIFFTAVATGLALFSAGRAHAQSAYTYNFDPGAWGRHEAVTPRFGPFIHYAPLETDDFTTSFDSFVLATTGSTADWGPNFDTQWLFVGVTGGTPLSLQFSEPISRIEFDWGTDPIGTGTSATMTASTQGVPLFTQRAVQFGNHFVYDLENPVDELLLTCRVDNFGTNRFTMDNLILTTVPEAGSWVIVGPLMLLAHFAVGRPRRAAVACKEALFTNK